LPAEPTIDPDSRSRIFQSCTILPQPRAPGVGVLPIHDVALFIHQILAYRSTLQLYLLVMPPVPARLHRHQVSYSKTTDSRTPDHLVMHIICLLYSLFRDLPILRQINTAIIISITIVFMEAACLVPLSIQTLLRNLIPVKFYHLSLP